MYELPFCRPYEPGVFGRSAATDRVGMGYRETYGASLTGATLADWLEL